MLAIEMAYKEGVEKISENVVRESPLVDAYFSADVETDGPIPGPYSILSFALVYVGQSDGRKLTRPRDRHFFYRELKPISDEFQVEALRINKLDREALKSTGELPAFAMQSAAQWIRQVAGSASPVLVAYPVSFDWSWLYWYFVRFCGESPFSHSRCFDIKTAFALKAGVPISQASRSKLLSWLRPDRPHTHHALDDALEQAEIFANILDWKGSIGRNS